MPRTKVRRTAENLVREVLRAYNDPKRGSNDFSKCVELAESYIRFVIRDSRVTMQRRLDEWVDELEGVNE